ncbi:hypothetical protein GCM10027275_37600 [Rhabdobacter roseus]|uniref:Uncharacterized protein n=1 Tax=Rhabdobacter roseus TaxID=1655419 RepID=A0A840TPW4_9BACT|nr:hypothetical protein [Rhabdobacter roseus]MBB5285831.1 hypothetical protein [Rhabdobacter roseus]
MKTSFKTLICALALSTTVAFAGTEKETNKPTTFATGVYATNSGKISVGIEKEAGVATTILLRNALGDIIHSEHVSKKQTKYQGKFDVSELQPGQYTLEVVANGEKEVKSFTISAPKVVAERTIAIQ